MSVDYDTLIETAARRVYDVAVRTSLDAAPVLSQRCGNTIYLKREDQQPVFSYKLRGAYNLMAGLGEQARQTGVIAASAGNHAQGVAYAARYLGIRTLIVMPVTTPRIKVDSVRRLGGEIILQGNTYDDAQARARELAAQHGYTLVPPYDHPQVIAGQATVGLELVQQWQEEPPRCVFVPVGGGGLIAGVALAVRRAWPDTRIIGVEPDEAPSLYEALHTGKPVRLPGIGIFADGAAVAQAGTAPFAVARDHVAEVLLVSIDEICAAVRDIFEDTRSVAEPAGALALAGLKQYVQREGLRDESLIAVFSGANLNFDRLRHIAELAALGAHQEALLAVTIPERPGSFRAFCKALGDRQITEFNYRYATAGQAHVFAGILLERGDAERDQIVRELSRQGYPVQDLSDNELAKMHVRHAIGGRATQIADERLYRFEFPERAGALLQFLTLMGDRWNISLFHYRNHGAAYGRVMMGIQVPGSESADFVAFLDRLGLKYWPESDNPAYQLFLGNGKK